MEYVFIVLIAICYIFGIPFIPKSVRILLNSDLWDLVKHICGAIDDGFAWYYIILFPLLLCVAISICPIVGIVSVIKGNKS